MRFTHLTALAAFVCIGSSGGASEPTDAYFLLSATIIDAGRTVGQPKLLIKADHPAKIDIGDMPGSRYTMTMVATPQSGDDILVDASIDFISTTGGHQTANPKMLVRADQESAIEFGRDDPSTKPFHIDFTLKRAIP